MGLMDEDMNKEPTPAGELALQTLAMPKDTNANGDVFGGWLVSQMDLAAGIATKQVTHGRSATVAIKNAQFLAPVSVGSVISCYAEILEIGRSSMHINIEVWSAYSIEQHARKKVAEGLFVFVAIDDNGRTRRIGPRKVGETTPGINQ